MQGIAVMKRGVIKMCGIGGIILIGSKRTQRQIKEIRSIAKRLLLELEKRGSDSTGITIVNKGYIRVFKQPIEARKFVKGFLFNDMLGRVTNDTNGILLHTRAVTQGSKENNLNNHPIIAGDIIGVHNGVVYNDDEIFRNFRQHFSRKAEVDSEAIFRLINHYLKSDSFNDIKSIKKALKKLYGSMAIGFVDRFKVNDFYLYSNSSYTPVTLAYIPELRVLVFASKKEYIRHSTKRRKRKKAYCFYHTLAENELLKINTHTSTYKKYRARTKKFDYEKFIKDSEIQDYPIEPVYKNYFSDYELELLKENNEFEKSEKHFIRNPYGAEFQKIYKAERGYC